MRTKENVVGYFYSHFCNANATWLTSHETRTNPNPKWLYITTCNIHIVTRSSVVAVTALHLKIFLYTGLSYKVNITVDSNKVIVSSSESDGRMLQTKSSIQWHQQLQADSLGSQLSWCDETASHSFRKKLAADKMTLKSLSSSAVPLFNYVLTIYTMQCSRANATIKLTLFEYSAPREKQQDLTKLTSKIKIQIKILVLFRDVTNKQQQFCGKYIQIYLLVSTLS